MLVVGMCKVGNGYQKYGKHKIPKSCINYTVFNIKLERLLFNFRQ
jgi:hypothetical protein